MKQCAETAWMKTYFKAILTSDWRDDSSFRRTTEWLQDNSGNVQEWPSQSPDLKLQLVWKELKMTIEPIFPHPT